MGSLDQNIAPFDPPSVSLTAQISSNVAAVRSPGRPIFTPGQLGNDADGKTPADFESQVNNALKNTLLCLKSAGGSVRDIAKLNLYVVGWNSERESQLEYSLTHTLTDDKGPYRPPSTLIPITALEKPEYLFQVDAVAYIKEVRPAALAEHSMNVSTLDSDVIVIGAGLSGLQAARDIQITGASCVVLEATDRVGGKILSHACKAHGVVDLGAAWLNDVSHSKLFALTKKYGLETVIQPTAGDEVLQNLKGASCRWAYGTVPKLSTADLQVVRKIYKLLDAAAAEADLHNPSSTSGEITFEEYLHSNGATGDAYQLLATMLRALLGVEPREVSLGYYVNYIKSGGGLRALGSDSSDGAQYMRLRKGMQSISKCLLNELSPGSVRLGDAVLGIEQNGSQCVVRTQNGLSYKSRNVIVSIPTTLYDTISFTPALPEDKCALSESTTLGYYSKVILIYSSPWWRDDNLNGAFISLNGPISFTRDTSTDEDKQYSITCFLIADPGRQWSILSKRKRKDNVLNHLASMAGPENSAKVYNTNEIVEREWSKESWCKGAPSPVMMPGLLSKYNHALRAPFARIHFIGTETAYEWKGYLEGAITSGERGAAEVLRALGKA